MFIANIFQCLQGRPEVGMPVARKDSVAVGQMHVGDPFAAVANRFGHIGLFNAHVKKVSH